MKPYIKMSLGEKVAHLQSRGVESEMIRERFNLTMDEYKKACYRTPPSLRQAVMVKPVRDDRIDSHFREGHSFEDARYA